MGYREIYLLIFLVIFTKDGFTAKGAKEKHIKFAKKDSGGICILFFTFSAINKNCNGKNGRL
jgi:hypothetical protein